MRNNFLKIFIGILAVSLFVIIYILSTASRKSVINIDLAGGNDFWHVSLNIQHDSELTIKPRRDDFKIPSEINADIIVNSNSIYTNKLKYIPSSNKNSLGKYMVNINLNSYLKKASNEVYVIVKYNDQSSKILLRNSD